MCLHPWVSLQFLQTPRLGQPCPKHRPNHEPMPARSKGELGDKFVHTHARWRTSVFSHTYNAGAWVADQEVHIFNDARQCDKVAVGLGGGIQATHDHLHRSVDRHGVSVYYYNIEAERWVHRRTTLSLCSHSLALGRRAAAAQGESSEKQGEDKGA